MTDVDVHDEGALPKDLVEDLNDLFEEGDISEKAHALWLSERTTVWAAVSEQNRLLKEISARQKGNLKAISRMLGALNGQQNEEGCP